MTINELIATSSVHAFNSGVASGRALERERIAKVLKGIAIKTANGEIAVMELLSAIENLIGKDND